MTRQTVLLETDQLVDELHVTFIHSKPMNWFLPNVPRTLHKDRG
jgi:hypothetical protein